ncbi:hypothetical protein VPH35_001878 [Triticum aestivum]
MPPTASPSASAIIAETASGYHHLKIRGYSSLKAIPSSQCLISGPFTVGGHRWRIIYYPNGDRAESAGHVSVFLFLDENVDKEVMARFQFGFKAENFASQGTWGYTKFVQWNALEKSKHLKGDSFTIRCDLAVVKRVRIEGTAQEAAPKFVDVPPSDLKQHLSGLFLTGSGADVVFEAGGETFAAHRCVLAARSPVFSAELFGSMKEGNTNDLVRIDGMEAQVFKALLCFVYTDSLPEMGKEEEDAMCQHLLLVCEDKLCKHINVGTAVNILALAELHGCPGLKTACIHFLSSRANLRAAMASDGFEHLSTTCPSVAKELIAMSSAP